MKRTAETSTDLATKKQRVEANIIVRRTFPRVGEQSAREEFFGTAEMLAHMLGRLPVIDLLLSQRTCKAFRDTFDSSRELQSQIHAPRNSTNETWHRYTVPQNVPLIVHDNTEIEAKIRRTRGAQPQHEPFKPICPNPVIFLPLAHRTHHAQLRFRGRLGPYGRYYPDSSCAYMQLSNPPMNVFRALHVDYSTSMIRNDDGVMMGDVITDAMQNGDIQFLESLQRQPFQYIDQFQYDTVMNHGKWLDRRWESLPQRFWRSVAEALTKEGQDSLGRTCRSLRLSVKSVEFWAPRDKLILSVD